MRKLFPLVLAAVAVLALPQALSADETKPGEKPAAEDPAGRPDRPDPADVFQWLDANGDGQLTLDELPPRAKERIGRWFPEADKNKDGKLSLDEFVPGLTDWRERHPRQPEGARLRRSFERPGAGLGLQGPGGPSEAKHERRDPEEIFKQFDKNHDNVLSPEEFTDGMKALHRFHRRPGPQGPSDMAPPECPRGPGGGHERPPQAILMIRPWAQPPAGLCEGHDHPGGPPPSEPFCWLGTIGKAMFEKLDANKDGKLIASEVPEKCRDRFERLLAKVDKDGDKALSWSETQEAAKDMIERMHMGMHWLAQGPHGGPRPAPVGPGERLMILRLLDTDHDGAISGREIIFASARLMMLDRNGDGVITERELMTPPCDPAEWHGAKHRPEFKDGRPDSNAPPCDGQKHKEKHKTDGHKKADDRKATGQEPTAATPEATEPEAEETSSSDAPEPSQSTL